MEKENRSTNPTDLERKNSVITQKWLETLENLCSHQMNQVRHTPYSSIFSPHQSAPLGQRQLFRDSSFQSDDSHCSSVESVLELRKPDPEEVLLSLGFGGPKRNSQNIGRIPARFLQPSKLIPHIDINEFLERYYGQKSGNLPQSVPSSPAHTSKRC